MISRLTGQIINRSGKTLILETQNGVGYRVNVSPDTLFKIGNKKELTLWTHLVVKEDALDLYGFLNQDELEFFEVLIGVSGVGPKTALSIIGLASLETLKKAIGTSDTSYLTKVSGIGKKTAEKIVLELRDKMGETATGPALKNETDALDALVSLGYGREEAREALRKTKSDSTEAKVKESLKILSSKN